MHRIYLHLTLLVLATEEIGYGIYPSATLSTIFRPIPKLPIPIQPPFRHYNEFAHELFEQVNTYLNTLPENLEGISSNLCKTRKKTELIQRMEPDDSSYLTLSMSSVRSSLI